MTFKEYWKKVFEEAKKNMRKKKIQKALEGFEDLDKIDTLCKNLE